MSMRVDLFRRRSIRARMLALTAVLCCCIGTQAKERKWIPAEVVGVTEAQVETENALYRSSQPNNVTTAPPLVSGAEKRTKKVYTYSFKTADKQYEGISEKKPVEGLSSGMKVQVVIQRGWVIVQMPDGKEKRLDLVP